MRKAPAWLVERMRELSATGPNLWIGPGLVFPPELRVQAVEEPQAESALAHTEPFAGVFVARAEGDLVEVLRPVRPLCAPGAVVALLLPEPGAGVRAALGKLLGPLGRRGRKPRSRAEQCGALLALGAVDIRVAPLARRSSYVSALIPADTSVLDREFVTVVAAPA